MQALAATMMTLLICVHDDSAFTEDEVVLNGQVCTIRVVSCWNASPIAAREEVRSRYLAHLTKLVTHRDVAEISPDDVGQIQERAQTILSEYEESHEERPRAYGKLYRTALIAGCSSQSLRQLESEWHVRTRRKCWGITAIVLIAPMLLTGLVAAFVRLDRRSLGDRRRLLGALGLIALITCGVTIHRLWQLL